MSHLIADDLDELHEMADAIGVKRKWFQRQSSMPHYDICKSKRDKAIQCGAVVLDRREFAKKMREIRLHNA